MFDDWADFTWGMTSFEDIYEAIGTTYTPEQCKKLFREEV